MRASSTAPSVANLPVSQFNAHLSCVHELHDIVSFFHISKASGRPLKKLKERHHDGGSLRDDPRDPVDRFVLAFNWRATCIAKPFLQTC